MSLTLFILFKLNKKSFAEEKWSSNLLFENKFLKNALNLMLYSGNFYKCEVEFNSHKIKLHGILVFAFYNNGMIFVANFFVMVVNVVSITLTLCRTIALEMPSCSYDRS